MGVTIIPLAHPARPPHTQTARMRASPVTGAAIGRRPWIDIYRRARVPCCRSSTINPHISA